MVVYCGHQLIQNCNNSSCRSSTFRRISTSTRWAPLERSGCSTSTARAARLERRPKPLDHSGVRPVPRARQVQVRSGREVQRPAGPERAQLPPQHRPAVPRFKTLTGNWAERAVRHHRLDRFLPDRFRHHGNSATLHGYFTQYIAEGILAKHAPGSRCPLKFLRRYVDSTRRVTAHLSSPQALHKKEKGL